MSTTNPGSPATGVVHLTRHDDRFFELVDTGGMGHMAADALTEDIEHQIDQAIDSADAILFIVDTREGMTPMDQEIAKRLRYLGVPVLCVANKTDDTTFDNQADDFRRLGHGAPIKASTLQNRGRAVLLNQLVDRLPPEGEGEDAPVEPDMKVAIVGRRNTGKSTFVNTLVQAERMIVSEGAGDHSRQRGRAVRARWSRVRGDRHARHPPHARPAAVRH